MKSLIIRKLFRSGAGAEDEELILREGVNVIVGRPNTGKTKWLQMLDFTFGSDKPPHHVFGDDLAAKYDLFQATLEIDGVEIIVERRWKEAGNRGKVFMDGAALLPQDFCAELLKRLDIPLLHYPQGSLYGVRTWPELSWRGLLRHIFRQQRFWSDLADNQPTSEQHACILQFVGVAEHLFSDDFGRLVEQQKQIWELQTRKEQFLNMLHEVSRDLLDEEDRGVALTPESIASALTRVREELAETEAAGKLALEELAQAAKENVAEDGSEQVSLFEEQSELLSRLRAKAESVRSSRAMIEGRIKETEEYRDSVTQELGRLQRAQAAGESFANLKVTHCPACDRAISPPSHDEAICYVCGREKAAIGGNGGQRIAFELEHLQAESQEADELLGALRSDFVSHKALEKSIQTEQRKSEALLRPVQQAAAAILPPELALLNVRSGQLEERIAQLQRIGETFVKRDKLTEQIQTIEKTVAELERAVEKKTSEANTESAGDWLADGMNDYFNSLNEGQANAWPQEQVHVRLGDRKFEVRVGAGRWHAKLGGTLTLYFLIAYHYGLLRLSARPQCHYPGLLILDFPPVLEDGSSVHDKENFIVEPFVDLVARPEYAHTQVIAVGAAFENLRGANRIELTRVWIEGGEVEENQDVESEGED